MRIGCLQFAPQVGDIDNNLNRADAVLSRANPEDLDLLVLPELAFTGYNFTSLEQISPFLEPSGSGITSLWARTTALKYNCVVAVGYPEKVDVTPKWPTGPEYYNSVIVVNGEGETSANYRKCHLYYTDETWALEGNEGFYSGYIRQLGDTAIGICMDLNPYKFEAPWNKFEFAAHILEYQSNLVIVSMAWMTREDGGLFSRMPNEPDMDTLTYWVTRLEPLIRRENEEEVIVIFANRTGIEDEAVYAGTSAVVGIQNGEVKVYGLLGRGEKELLVVDTENPPYARLVCRPASGSFVPAQAELEETGASPRSLRSSWRGLGTETEEQSKPGGRPPAQSGTGSSSSSSRPQNEAKKKKSRPSEPIHIPPRSSAAAAAAQDSPNIPTPSAPSPTPAAIRPKLIIPQSPASQTYDGMSPLPLSSISTHSVQSIRSVQSVKSNGRPPAESTPYPDTSDPLSGYPKPFPNGTVYGEHSYMVDTDHLFSPLSPITFSDTMSPVHPQFPSFPTDSQAAMEKTAWASHGPRRHAPSPNTAIQGPERDEATTPNQRSWVHPHYHASRDSPRASDKVETWSSKAEEESQGRPSSPKSRNASRSRMHGQSDSLQDQNEISAAILRQVEMIAQRADSASRHRHTADEAGRSRDCSSRGGPTERAASAAAAGGAPDFICTEIGRIASRDDVPVPSQSPARPMSRRGFQSQSRSRSITSKKEVGRGFNHREQSWTANEGRQMESGPAHRRPSRGRQPGPDNFFLPDSSPAGVVRGGSQRRDLSSSSSLSASMNDSSLGGEEEFEAVESVVCPRCPVHGAASASGTPTVGPANRTDPNDIGHASAEPRNSPRLGAGQHGRVLTADRQRPNTVSPVKQGTVVQDLIAQSRAPRAASADAMSLETISATSQSPATPTGVDLGTPKAMTFTHIMSLSGEDNDTEVLKIRNDVPVMASIDRGLMDR